MYSGYGWYFGFNCNNYGTGFESELFLDDSCTIYSPRMKNYYPINGNVRVGSDMTSYMMQNADYFLQNPQYCEGEGVDGKFCENVLGGSVDVITCARYGQEPEEGWEGQYENAANQQQACDCAAQDEEAADEGAQQEQAQQEDVEAEDEQAQEEEPQDEQAEEEAQNGGERKMIRRLENVEAAEEEQGCECADNGKYYQLDSVNAGDVEGSCADIRAVLAVSYDMTNAQATSTVSSWHNVKNGGQPSTQGSGFNMYWIIGIVLAAVACIAAFVVLRKRNLKKADSKKEPLVSSSNKPARVTKPKMKKESIEIYFQGSKNESSVAC
jgi:hypothetical protein